MVSAAVRRNVALYAVHLPLDANRAYGNNYELARYLGLKNLTPAFVYHGETIGCTGTLPNGKKVGVCSGGAGEFATDAKNLGCDLYITGEASWGDVIAAENPLRHGDLRRPGAREGDEEGAPRRHRLHPPS